MQKILFECDRLSLSVFFQLTHECTCDTRSANPAPNTLCLSIFFSSSSSFTKTTFTSFMDCMAVQYASQPFVDTHCDAHAAFGTNGRAASTNANKKIIYDWHFLIAIAYASQCAISAHSTSDPMMCGIERLGYPCSTVRRSHWR